MANKINRTDIYPNTAPADDDFVLGTDVSDTTNDANGEVVTFKVADILEKKHNRVLRSRAEFVTWASAATPTSGEVASVNVGGDAGVIQFIYDGTGTDFTEAALAGWHAVAPVYLEHFGVVTTSDKTSEGTDYTTQVQAAMDATEGELLFTGFVKITDKVICPNRCTLKAPKGRTYGGLSVFDDFNLSATCVLQPGTSEAGATIDGLTIWFEQPEAAANRAALTQYPPAINIGLPAGEAAIVGNPEDNAGIPRGHIKSIRIERAWDGIIGIGNCGGYKFGIVELGCFNRGMEIDGALDFVHADTIHIWPFGFASVSALTDIFYDSSTIGVELKKIDNWTCADLSMFRVKGIIGRTGETSTLPYQFGSIALDGNSARLEIKGDSSQIGILYATAAADAPSGDRPLLCSGGRNSIGHVQIVSPHDGAILCNSGFLHISGGYIQNTNQGHRGILTQGDGYVDASNIAMRWPDLSRTNAFIEQQGTSVLRIRNAFAVGSYAADEELIKFASDVEGNLLDCPGLAPHTANFDLSWNTGFYSVGAGVFPANFGNGEAAQNVQLRALGDAQGERTGLAFYPTFEGSADNGPRRAADILAGFNGGTWGNEFLAFHVGIGSPNGSENLTPEKARLTKDGFGIGTTSPTHALDVAADSIRIRTAQTPASASATGTQGEIAWDANYLYVCTATDTWKRVAIATW